MAFTLTSQNKAGESKTTTPVQGAFRNHSVTDLNISFPDHIFYLQEMIDNQAVQRLMRSNTKAFDFAKISIQQKQNIDPSEHKNEKVSEMEQMPASGALSTNMLDPTGMPSIVRAKMEHAFEADLSDVQIQVGSARALELGAQAFTQGSEIHVAPGYWAPETPEGQVLLGHEIVHILQQRAARVTTTNHLAGASLSSNQALEREADMLGTKAASGQSGIAPAHIRREATPLVKTHGVAQRQPLPPPPPGSPVEGVIQALGRVSPIAGVGDFPAAFRILDSLSVDELLAALTDLEGRHNLDLLIANSGSAAQFNQTKLVTAMQVVRQSHGAGANLQTAHATIAASGLPPAEQQAMTVYLLPSTRAADQRVLPPGPGAMLPSADLSRELGYELDPSSLPVAAIPPARGAPAPAVPPLRVPWDGSTGAPGSAAARATMQTELFGAYDAYLKFFRPRTVAALALPRVAFTAPAAAAGGPGPTPTGVVDIANQARTVLETRYNVSMDAAAISPAQLSGRSIRQASGPGQNIFEASSEADRSTLTGAADLAPGVSWWLFENDAPGAAGAPKSRRFATDILAAHHYSTQDPGAEQFRWDVANAYAAASTLNPNNRRQLIDYRMTNWSEKGSKGSTLTSSFDSGKDRNRAELGERWNIFKTAIHESIHLREHPAFEAAEQGRGTMQEGFVEMFTFATLNTDVLPRVRSGSVEPLRRTVEGALSTPAPDATLITNRVTPTQYALHRAQAERIRDGGAIAGGVAHAGVGEAAVRAAFFQGHVEYLGLEPTGAQLTTLPPAGATPLTRIPGGITGLDDLARRSGVPRQTIVRENPGITDTLPHTAVLSGCREHWVISGETRANIAAQHGVSETDLAQANPDIPIDLATGNWSALPAGQRILIPVH